VNLNVFFGEPGFVLGENTGGTRFVPKVYTIPDDPDTWPFFVYIGSQIFGVQADVPAVRRIEFERMILKYFPEHLWVMLFINYT